MYNLDDYSQQSSSESETSIAYLKRKNKPLFFKHSSVKVNFNKLLINLSNCHYEVLSEIADDLDLRVTPNKHNWDLYWTDHAIQKEQLFRLLDHQKINHFPGMYILARKNCLAKGLMKMRKSHPNQYNFFPLTWTIPSEANELKIFRQQLINAGQHKTAFIVKPEASCQGKGIKITLQPEKVDEQCVVQLYISNPFLIGGLKFDFRLYVLLAGCDPLRIYLYREGLARFSTEMYSFHPSKKNLKKTMIHLTNYAINKTNPKFVFNKNVSQAHLGHKRSYSAVLRTLSDMDVDTFTLQMKINQMIVKTIISGQPFLAHQYNLSLPDNYANDMCFQILGFDILLNSDLEPILLEVNHTPSFATQTPIDHHIKYTLIKDTITLMNISLDNKKEKVLARQQFTKDRQNRIYKKYSNEEKAMFKLEQQRKRDYYENSHRGNYQKIYPTEDKDLMNIYDDLLAISNSLFRKQNIGGKEKSVHIFKKSESMASTTMRRTSKQLPPLKTLKSEYSPVKQPVKKSTKLSMELIKQDGKDTTSKIQMERLIQQQTQTQQEIIDQVGLSLKDKKKSLSIIPTKSSSSQKIPMLKTVISFRNLHKIQNAKDTEKNPIKVLKKLQKTQKVSSTREGNYLQPKLMKLQNNPSREPFKGIHYLTAIQQRLPINYQKYILKHNQRRKKQTL